MDSEVIVVGSGAAAVHLAQTLVEAQVSVLMLDVGISPAKSENHSVDSTFSELRKTDKNQYLYFLGKELETVEWQSVKVGAQLSSGRQYMTSRVEALTPKESSTFFPYESLAQGGLGVAWGAGCYAYSVQELERCGLDPNKMESSYQTIGQRIGVSCPSADVEPYTLRGLVDHPEASIELNSVFKDLYLRYQKNRPRLSLRHFAMGVPSLAILAKNRNLRQAHGYREMDFYDDNQKSIYRPWMTLEELRTNKYFKYLNQILVTQFETHAEGVVVHGFDINKQTSLSFRSKRLALAAGVLGTSRIVLRSLREKNQTSVLELPILCNNYTYVPTLNLSHIGKEMDEKSLALSQLLLTHQNPYDPADVATASVYNYKTLLLFRLIKESFFSIKFSRELFQYLQSGLIIFGIHHPDGRSGGRRSLRLINDSNSLTKDRLLIDFDYSDSEMKKIKYREKEFEWAIRQLGCWPVKKVRPPAGASIHYAGTLPYSQKDLPLTLNQLGQLRDSPFVYVADGSGLNYLPAKGLTFTLMAIGDKTARNMISEIKT